MKTMIRVFATAFLFLTGNAIVAVDVGVKEPDACLVCHSEFEELTKKSHVHTAFAAGKCSACHNPHASEHASLLNNKAGDLCLECHGDIGEKARLSDGHKPAAQGECLTCHDPHASEHTAQVLQPLKELCSGCHTAVSGWLERKYIHSPVSDGECLACHNPHGTDNKHILTASPPQLCFGCHSEDASFNAAHKGYKLSQSNCITCHDPHASDANKLIMPNQHAPFKGGSCSACHKMGGVSPFELAADIKQLCTRCHSTIKQQADKIYHHNLDDDRSCLNCHNPHASSSEKLLKAKQQVVCLNCHFKDEKYADKKPETILTHDGMDCTNCHQPHGSDIKRYFVADGMELCLRCHSDAHKGSHPLGEDIIDPRTNQQVTCFSCHQLHGADYKPYLPLNPAMDLCLQCHRK